MKAQVKAVKKRTEPLRIKVVKLEDGRKEHWHMVAGRWRKVA